MHCHPESAQVNRKPIARINLKAASVLLCALPAGAAMAIEPEEAQISASFGGFYSQGDYGQRDMDDRPVETDIWALPISVRYKTERWSVSYAVAYLRIDGSEDILVIDGDTVDDEFEDPLIFTESRRRVREGFGDSLLTFDYRPAWGQTNLGRLNLGTKLKLPTSDSANELGTGETDISVFGGLSYRWRAVLVHAQLGYQWMGDTDTTDYDNRWFGSLGGVYLFNKSISAGGKWYYKQASRSGREGIDKLNAFLAWRPDRTWTYTLYSTFGLSASSADIATGLQATYHF